MKGFLVHLLCYELNVCHRKWKNGPLQSWPWIHDQSLHIRFYHLHFLSKWMQRGFFAWKKGILGASRLAPLQFFKSVRDGQLKVEEKGAIKVANGELPWNYTRCISSHHHHHDHFPFVGEPHYRKVADLTHSSNFQNCIHLL